MKKHGLSNHKIYQLWINIRKRCYNPDTINYKWYGGKGIGVCDQWIQDFMSFYNWSINNGWQEGLTIDRIDSNKNYSPENCRFISMSENSKSRCRENKTVRSGTRNPNKKLNLSDVSFIKETNISLKELAEKFEVSYTQIWRIKNNKQWNYSL